MKWIISSVFILSIIIITSCFGGSKDTEPEVDKEKLYQDQKALAVASLRRGNFQRAMEEIDEAQAIGKKEDPEIYLIRGAIYFGLKDYPVAESNYKRALEIRPGYSQASFNLCGLYLKEEKYDAAIAECNKVVADPVFNARENAYTNIGLAYFNKGDIASARDNYEKALQINPAFVYAHNELGRLYMATGREGEAIDEFKLAIAGLPTYEEAYYNLGLAYLKIDDRENACESFTEVVNLSPNSEFGMNSNRYLTTVCN